MMQESAIDRWGRLVRARLDEVERLRPEGGPAAVSYWDAQASRFARRLGYPDTDEPVVARLRALLRPSDELVDVGAGTGRFAIPLADHVRGVTAVDPSEGMLTHLRDAADRRKLVNIRTVAGRWPESEARGDVVLSSFVLPIVPDAAEFVRGLDAAASREVIILMAGASNDLLFEPFCRHFHGRARAPSPTFLDALGLLEELGLAADLEIVETPPASRYADVADAVDDYRRNLLLPDGDEQVTAELERVLRPWLAEDGSMLRAPVASTPVALLRWSAGAGA